MENGAKRTRPSTSSQWCWDGGKVRAPHPPPPSLSLFLRAAPGVDRYTPRPYVRVSSKVPTPTLPVLRRASGFVQVPSSGAPSAPPLLNPSSYLERISLVVYLRNPYLYGIQEDDKCLGNGTCIRLKRTGGAESDKVSRTEQFDLRPGFPGNNLLLFCNFCERNDRVLQPKNFPEGWELRIRAPRGSLVKNSRRERRSTLHAAKFRSNRAVISSV